MKKEVMYPNSSKDEFERNVSEIMSSLDRMDEQIKESCERLKNLREQARVCEEKIEQLKRMRQMTEERHMDAFIDNWLNKKFGIPNQRVAKNGIFLVFDEDGRFIKTVSCGYGADFHHVGPAKDKDTLEHWLKKNKLYAQSASSFCSRSYVWYQMTFREQLENLFWEFGQDGKLISRAW